MSGPLLGALAAGAGVGFATGSAQNMASGTQMNIAALQNEVKALLDERVAERADAAAVRASAEKVQAADVAYNRELGLKGVDHTNRMEEGAVDKQVKQAQLKKIQEDDKIPTGVKTEYASLEKQIEQMTGAVAKARVEGNVNESGLQGINDDLKKMRERQHALISPYQGDLAAKKTAAPGLDDLFPAKAKPAAAPKAEEWVTSTRQGRDVTPYEDKLKALIARQPNRSAPQAEIKQWEAELVKLKASKNQGIGLLNRGA